MSSSYLMDRLDYSLNPLDPGVLFYELIREYREAHPGIPWDGFSVVEQSRYYVKVFGRAKTVFGKRRCIVYIDFWTDSDSDSKAGMVDVSGVTELLNEIAEFEDPNFRKVMFGWFDKIWGSDVC